MHRKNSVKFSFQRGWGMGCGECEMAVRKSKLDPRGTRSTAPNLKRSRARGAAAAGRRSSAHRPFETCATARHSAPGPGPALHRCRFGALFACIAAHFHGNVTFPAQTTVGTVGQHLGPAVAGLLAPSCQESFDLCAGLREAARPGALWRAVAHVSNVRCAALRCAFPRLLRPLRATA